MEHDWYSFYEDERTYKEVAACRNCSVSVDRPQDLYPILECPPVEMFTPEWCQLLGVMPNCDLQFVLEIHES